jgi:hypothetical protein
MVLGSDARHAVRGVRCAMSDGKVTPTLMLMLPDHYLIASA